MKEDGKTSDVHFYDAKASWRTSLAVSSLIFLPVDATSILYGQFILVCIKDKESEDFKFLIYDVDKNQMLQTGIEKIQPSRCTLKRH